MADLPDIIRSRVGPQVVTTMSEALDRIITLDVHHERCQSPVGCDHGFCGCFVDCPTGIALKAVHDIGGLQDIAVTAGH